MSIELARKIASESYGLDASARTLPGYLGSNFLLEDATGRRFVLKIAGREEDPRIFEMQVQALRYVASRDPALPCPCVQSTTDGADLTTARLDCGSVLPVCLLTYLAGRPAADLAARGPQLREDIGRTVARLDRALVGFEHSALQRPFDWDLRHAGDVVRRHLAVVSDADRRALIQRFLERFTRLVEPSLDRLPSAVIHNDANDYNVLVGPAATGGTAVIGIIDFGDMVRTCRGFEPAIACAYALLRERDPIAAAADVIRGYRTNEILTEPEIEHLFDLICMRLCLSVTIAAHQRALRPDNAYLAISERPAWQMLAQLARMDVNQARRTFEEVCGSPTPGSPTLGLD